MDFQKLLNNFLKEKKKKVPKVIVTAKEALRKSGYENYEVFIHNGKFVLLDTSKNVEQGTIVENNIIKDFKNTDDFKTVTVDAYARYNILSWISNGEDLLNLKSLFEKRRTWIIHCVTAADSFEAHTHGLDAYSHHDFRIHKDFGKVEIAYLFNSLAKSIQRGNAFRDGDKIENLYDNCDVLLTKSDDGYFDVSFVGRNVMH